ncbi:hypothetical protein A9O63_06650 [Cereibacter johrii]|nr:hypothetical protein A9O63_06650 [Cereibacter johrii]
MCRQWQRQAQGRPKGIELSVCTLRRCRQGTVGGIVFGQKASEFLKFGDIARTMNGSCGKVLVRQDREMGDEALVLGQIEAEEALRAAAEVLRIACLGIAGEDRDAGEAQRQLSVTPQADAAPGEIGRSFASGRARPPWAVRPRDFGAMRIRRAAPEQHQQLRVHGRLETARTAPGHDARSAQTRLTKSQQLWPSGCDFMWIFTPTLAPL